MGEANFHFSKNKPSFVIKLGSVLSHRRSENRKLYVFHFQIRPGRPASTCHSHSDSKNLSQPCSAPPCAILAMPGQRYQGTVERQCTTANDIQLCGLQPSNHLTTCYNQWSTQPTVEASRRFQTRSIISSQK